MYVCMYVCMYVSFHKRTTVRMYTFMHTTSIYTCPLLQYIMKARTRAHTYKNVPVFAHTSLYIHTFHTYSYIHTYVRTHSLLQRIMCSDLSSPRQPFSLWSNLVYTYTILNSQGGKKYKSDIVYACVPWHLVYVHIYVCMNTGVDAYM